MTLRYSCPDDHILIAVDPGKRACGVAMGRVGWQGTALYGMGLIPAEEIEAWAHRRLGPCLPELRWVAEVPQQYKLRQSTTSGVQALLDTLARLPPRVAEWSPQEWKRNVPKGVHHQRTWDALTLIERDRFYHTFMTDHNTRDAVALWLFAVGRTGPGGRKP